MRNRNSTRKSICILTDIFVMGGVEKVVIDTAKILVSSFDITIVTLYGKPDLSLSSMLPENIHLKYLQAKHSTALDLLLAAPILGGCYLKKLLGDVHYDILISLKPLTLMASYCHCASKTIYWCHGDKDLMYAPPNKLNFYRKINKIRLRLGYKHYDSVWTVNPLIKEGLQKAFKLKNISVLPNPINCASILQSSQEECDIPFHSALNIITVGRLSFEKGFDRVVNAIQTVDPNIVDFHWYIIGDGWQRKQLEQMVHDSNLDNCVTFLGKQVNPYKYMRHAQVLICPSRTESFGLVMLEALLLKIPIITTATSGGKYLAENGKNGILVPNNDDAVCDAVRSYLSCPSNFEIDVDSGFHKALNYDISNYSVRLIQLLNQANTQ